ncbi:type II secretion system minor pseudopilin GspK [Phenylobacterium sp.]|uniref:type II secretion system minor pseudopilin GspK n=1 Tax=Phenylobacterium sp. TaxID=1871053 RepID=UPI0035B41D9E
MSRADDERGVALLTVLLLVAVMATLAAGVLEEIRFSIRRTANAEAVGQARWYAMGAEQLARAQVARLAASGSVAGAWSGRGASFPVEGGLIRARIDDGAACFNLNSVVAGAPDAYRRNDEGVRQFVNLASALGLRRREGEMLAAALVDWIDSDPLREASGAEDESYGSADGGYLTSGALLAEPSELRAVRGFTPEVYRRLRPFVCALPAAQLSPLNINTIPEEKAVLIGMLAPEPLPPEAARRLIAARPPQGWTRSDFLALPAVIAAALPAEASGQLTDTSSWFRLETEVTLGDAEAVATSLLARDAAGRVRVVARRWGPEE